MMHSLRAEWTKVRTAPGTFWLLLAAWACGALLCGAVLLSLRDA